MAKKKESVSISQLDKILGGAERERDIEYCGIQIRVRTLLDFAEYIQLVDGVVESCFGEDNDYRPEIREFAMRFGIVSSYTNVRLPKDTGHKYEVLYLTDLVDVVKSAIIPAQLKDIEDAVDREIEHRLRMSAASAEEKANIVVSKLNELLEGAQQLFSGLTQEDVESVLSAVGNGKIDEERLMAAYLDMTGVKENGNKTVV